VLAGGWLSAPCASSSLDEYIYTIIQYNILLQLFILLG
jgi:hypothetical protein